MKKIIKIQQRDTRSPSKFSHITLWKLQNRHKLTKYMTNDSTIPLTLIPTPGRTREEINRQLEAETERNRGRVYAGLSYLK